MMKLDKWRKGGKGILTGRGTEGLELGLGKEGVIS